MALPLKWIPRAVRFLIPFRKGIQEAADQYIGKKSKAQTLDDLVMVRDHQELAEADRAGVAALRTKYGLGMTTAKGAGDRDTWACDDMTINASRGGMAEMLLGAVLGAAGLYFLGDKLNGPSPAPAPTPTATPDTPVVVDDTEYEVRFYDANGNLINVPRYTPPAN